MRCLIAGVFCLGLLLVPGLRARQTPGTVSVLIEVTDPAGTAVGDAHIRLVPAPDRGPARMETDGKGHLAIDLQPGGYALFVSCPGFAGFTSHIEVKAEGETQIIPVGLRIAPLSPPLRVYPPSEKDDLFISVYPYHEDVLIRPADFKSFPHTTITIRNAHANADETYSGVPLAELLMKFGAPVGKELHGIALISYIVATGADGYPVVLSLAEVDRTFHPGTVLVADSLSGRPLDARSGPFELVVSEDKRPARWVRHLAVLELKSAP